MKKLFLLLIAALLILSSCEMSTSKAQPSADIEQQKKTDQMMTQANKELGMPAIVNFQEKKNLKWIYELCDQQDFICYAYFYNSFEGKLGDYIGECIGYGIPYSAQYSNPEKIASRYHDYGTGAYAITLPQPEPNGIFKPEGLSATWLIMIDPDTKKPMPVYFEPTIIVSPFKLKS